MKTIYDSINYFTTSDGVEIEYADLGGNGPILLFIPGYSLATDLVLPALAKYSSDYRMVTLTLRGFGGSNPKKAKGSEEKGEISIVQAAKDIKELIHHLKLDKCIMVGYSMGTHVAFSYIEKFGCNDISKLIILDMTPKLVNDATWNLGLYQGHYTASQREKDLEAMKNNYVDGFNKYFFYQAAFAHNSSEPRDYIFTPDMMTAIDEYAKWYNIEGLTGEILTYVPPSKWMLYRTYWQDMCLKDYRHMLNKINVPTGILYADPGSIYDVRTAMYLKENIINSRCYSIKGAVHTSLITFSTEETFKQISQFLKDASNNI